MGEPVVSLSVVGLVTEASGSVSLEEIKFSYRFGTYLFQTKCFWRHFSIWKFIFYISPCF